MAGADSHETWSHLSSSAVSDADFSENSDFSDDDSRSMRDCDWNPPCTLHLEYWKRSEEVQRLKDDHIDFLDAEWESREARILNTTLRDEDVVLEQNMFPYDTPVDIKHYTLWSLHEMSHSEICKFVVKHCLTHLPSVVEWNYEENSHRSIDIPHVHVFLKFSQEELKEALQPTATGSCKRKARDDDESSLPVLSKRSKGPDASPEPLNVVSQASAASPSHPANFRVLDSTCSDLLEHRGKVARSFTHGVSQ